MKIVLSFCACLCSAQLTYAQLEASQWYFGNYAGLDFSTNSPIALTNGKLSAVEGSASIADRKGNLIFYTDGVTVYDHFHQPMANGHNLWGHYSTTQTLIVPQPNNDFIYYVFTMSPQHDAIFGEDSVGCHYSIIDMQHNNGMGSVIVKNQLLFKNTTEKITAVHHRNGEDIWILTHEWNNNSFRSYLINQGGLNTNPVISNVGSIHEGGGFMPSDNENAIGQMKISPDGTLVGLVISRKKMAEVFLFDNSSGEVTGLLGSFSLPSRNNVGEYYGMEFSPNSKLLYISIAMGCGSNDPEFPSELWQYSVKKKESTKVGEFIGSLNALQLGVDGKIYISRCNIITNESDYLGIVHKPNLIGTGCNFQSSGIHLLSGRNVLGLPNFIQSHFLFPDPVVDMPNVFTPNGDPYNPVFMPIVYDHLLEAHMKIINRWGQEVYSTSDVTSGWDGDQTPAGVYYWLLQYEGKNGKTGTMKGYVHLLR